MKISESGEKANRQCWECLKRRLVCDRTLPHCNKCQKAGRECPGYDEQKPLQWVEPGKVSSRRRKKDRPPKIYTSTSNQHNQDSAQETCPHTVATPTFAEDDEIIDPTSLQLVFKAYRMEKGFWGDEAEDQRGEILRDLTFRHGAAAKEVARIFQIGGRAKIEEVVSNRLHKEAAKMLQWEKDPLKILEGMLWTMRRYDLPTYDYLSNETSEVVQAVHYYNGRIHPEVKAAGELAPNPAVIPFPLHALHLLPPAIHHTLVCLALNHFVHSLPVGSSDRATVASNRSKVYHHRGAAIRALSHYVGQDKTRCSDLTITSILVFMSVELQNPAFADWRSHASGMQRLIDMRGGLKNLLKESSHLASTLVIYILIVTVANTCSPAWDQVDISGNSPDGSIEEIAAIYSLIFPYTLCPPELFFDMLRINRLRSRAFTSMKLCEIDPDHPLEAHDLLAHIEAFVPEDWAQPGRFYDEWLLIGTIYQAAIAIYCTLSLQSLTVLPDNLEMNAMRSIHGDRLLENLKQALKSPRLAKFITFPVVVAGVEAVYRSGATRNWVESTLTDLSRLLGTSSPLKARAVLRRYWQKGETGWDQCFDRPYVFVI